MEVNTGSGYDTAGPVGTQSFDSADRDFERALKELGEGNVLAALACLEKALKVRDNPGWYSYLGFCIAKERGQVTRGLELCRTAISHEPDNPSHYLYLAKLHLVSGNKVAALEALRQGVSVGGSPEITNLFEVIGTRKPPVIPHLSRNNPINIWLGVVLSRLGLR